MFTSCKVIHKLQSNLKLTDDNFTRLLRRLSPIKEAREIMAGKITCCLSVYIYATIFVLVFGETTLKMDTITLLFSLVVLFHKGGCLGDNLEYCESHQYLELGRKGKIHCFIQEQFYFLSWYNSTDYKKEYPVIFISDTLKEGDGLVSGEYDIDSQGSLIINEVSLKHERTYTLLLLFSEKGQPVVTNIQVTVTARPSPPFPFIDDCNLKGEICLQQKKKNHYNCTVYDTRPIINLTWTLKTAYGNKNISSVTYVSQGQLGYTSIAIAKLPSQSLLLLHLLACKAEGLPRMLTKNESLVLVEDGNTALSSSVPISLSVKLASKVELNCLGLNKNVIHFVWKRKQPKEDWFHELGFGVLNEEYTQSYDGEFEIGVGGSLVIPDMRMKQEGMYGCISGDGVTDETTLYNVTVIEQTTEECHYTTRHICQPETSAFDWMNFATLLVIVFTLLLNLILKQKRLSPRQDTITTDENVPMIEIESFTTKDLEVLKKEFLKQLKEKYEILCNSVHPVPYDEERHYCVNKVFVEPEVEELRHNEGTGGQQIWENIGTYQNIVSTIQVKSKRRLLEGRPGCGKSTFVLQLVYDWNNSSITSTLGDMEYLIFLRLRQVRGVTSIYKVIKDFLLPKDTRISETAVKYILCNSKSVLMVLDGFDEYPDKDCLTQSEVKSIIAKEMCQDFQVIVTTRSSVLPKEMFPSTQRLRLKEFDEKKRRLYIAKMIQEDFDATEKIIKCLQQNPVLDDLCNVTLLFVIFAHMAHENRQFQNLKSVTSLFRYMMDCFHSHFKNKMGDDDNVHHFKAVEDNYKNIGKIVYETLRTSKSKTWNSEEFVKEEGKDLYEMNVRTGIFLEEEAIDIVDEPGTSITGRVQISKKVRFLHSIFSEWYAAHYLSDYLKQNSFEDLEKLLQNLDPADLNYLYRFICGLHPKATRNIIEYLNNSGGGIQFAILCILEKDGKIDKECIEQLSKEKIVVSGHDSLLLQKTSFQLLERAAALEINIKGLSLHNCLKSVDGHAIKTCSDMILTTTMPIKQLVITLSSREIAENEARNVIEFSAKCHSLNRFGFYGCVPPLNFKVGSALQSLRSRNVEVWFRVLRQSHVYYLNLESGKWMKEKDETDPTAKPEVELTEVERKKMLQERSKKIKEKKSENYQGNLKQGRMKYNREAAKESSSNDLRKRKTARLEQSLDL